MDIRAFLVRLFVFGMQARRLANGLWSVAPKLPGGGGGSPIASEGNGIAFVGQKLDTSQSELEGGSLFELCLLCDPPLIWRPAKLAHY